MLCLTRSSKVKKVGVDSDLIMNPLPPFIAIVKRRLFLFQPSRSGKKIMGVL